MAGRRPPGQAGAVTLNPPTQYADDANLRARQRLWDHQDPPFDLVAWVLEVAGAAPGRRVLEVGCGNGVYLRELVRRGVEVVGCDLSIGMLRAAGRAAPRINGDVTALPVADDAFDVVLAPHMLYHVPDREAAAHELRRVLRPGGCCVAVTNGAGHMRALRRLVEEAVRQVDPTWEMRNPSTHAFSLENGAAQLEAAFDEVTCMRTNAAPVPIRDASLATDYVASVGDHYAADAGRPWAEVVEHVRREVQRTIDADGVFEVAGDTGAFVCR